MYKNRLHNKKNYFGSISKGKKKILQLQMFIYTGYRYEYRQQVQFIKTQQET
jgi:hypothetical protein